MKEEFANAILVEIDNEVKSSDIDMSKPILSFQEALFRVTERHENLKIKQMVFFGEGDKTSQFYGKNDVIETEVGVQHIKDMSWVITDEAGVGVVVETNSEGSGSFITAALIPEEDLPGTLKMLG